MAAMVVAVVAAAAEVVAGGGLCADAAHAKAAVKVRTARVVFIEKLSG
jgi:hypothetical protein